MILGLRLALASALATNLALCIEDVKALAAGTAA